MGGFETSCAALAVKTRNNLAMTSPRVLMLGSSSDSHANAIFEALSDGPLVVVDFPSEFSEPFPVSGTDNVSTIRSVRGVATTDLEQGFNNLRGVVNVGAQLLEGVDAIVVTPREALEAWVTERSSLRLFRRLGIGEVVLIESTDGGWERAQAALHVDGVEGVRVSAVRPRDGGRRRNYPERPLATVLARNGFGELMAQREYDAAIRDARTSRHDELAGARGPHTSGCGVKGGWLSVITPTRHAHRSTTSKTLLAEGRSTCGPPARQFSCDWPTRMPLWSRSHGRVDSRSCFVPTSTPKASSALGDGSRTANSSPSPGLYVSASSPDGSEAPSCACRDDPDGSSRPTSPRRGGSASVFGSGDFQTEHSHASM